MCVCVVVWMLGVIVQAVLRKVSEYWCKWRCEWSVGAEAIAFVVIVITLLLIGITLLLIGITLPLIGVDATVVRGALTRCAHGDDQSQIAASSAPNLRHQHSHIRWRTMPNRESNRHAGATSRHCSGATCTLTLARARLRKQRRHRMQTRAGGGAGADRAGAGHAVAHLAGDGAPGETRGAPAAIRR
jgi:hypothetical protein